MTKGVDATTSTTALLHSTTAAADDVKRSER